MSKKKTPTKNTPRPDEKPLPELLLDYIKGIPETDLDAEHTKQLGFALSSASAAAEYSEGSEMRLKHMEARNRSRMKARVCELVESGQSPAAAVATVLNLPVENVELWEQRGGASEASAENKGGKKSSRKKSPATATGLPSRPQTVSDDPQSSSHGSATASTPSATLNTDDSDDGGSASRSNVRQFPVTQSAEPRPSGDESAEPPQEPESGTDGARYFKVIDKSSQYVSLYGREVSQEDNGSSVTLEIPLTKGDWIEETFERVGLLTATEAQFEAQERECDGWTTTREEIKPGFTVTVHHTPAMNAAGETTAEQAEPLPCVTCGASIYAKPTGKPYPVDSLSYDAATNEPHTCADHQPHRCTAAELDALIESAAARLPELPHKFRTTTGNPEACGFCSTTKESTCHKVRPAKNAPAALPGDFLGYAVQHRAGVAYRRKNPFEGKKLTDARRRDWQIKLNSATEHLQEAYACAAIAAHIEAGTLPAVLYGVTNDQQVSGLLRMGVREAEAMKWEPQNMGATIKTKAQQAEAARALAALVPDVEPFTVAGELDELPPAATGGTLNLQDAAPAGETTPAPDQAAVDHYRFWRVAAGSGDYSGRIGFVPAGVPPYNGDKVELQFPSDNDDARESYTPHQLFPATYEEFHAQLTHDERYIMSKREHVEIMRDAERSILSIETLEALAEAREGVRARGRALNTLGTSPDDMSDWNAQLWRVQMDAIIKRERELKERAAQLEKIEAAQPEVDEDEQTEKVEAIVRQLVKCESFVDLDEAISRYRLKNLDDVEGLTRADREQITYCIGIRRERIGEIMSEHHLGRTLDRLSNATSMREVEKIENDLEQLLKQRGLYLDATQSERLGAAENAARDRINPAPLITQTSAASPTIEAINANLDPTFQTMVVEHRVAGGRCGGCGYKLPSHALSCRVGAREEAAAVNPTTARKEATG